ncbi:porin [Amylibacter sp. SFDW26]|uniref:porin n=1 Tax=Amylibacter sp. SFDW26 TaxID=2652722 RepID=UPI0012627E9C|nr:porin [Amylibacter sp. SFDW26]KAB7614296.1 porin [Amylibacter sp. SFDW26]
MKNSLLCTTAVAIVGFTGAANAADNALEVKVGGFYNAILSFTSVDGPAGTDFDGADVFTNAEIIFKPSLTLDNGIKIGAEIQLEADSGANGDQIDESFITITGNFGQLVIGSENSAGYKLTKSAPDVSLIFANSSSLTAFIPFSGAAGGVNTGDDFFRGTLGTTFLENARNNDANRITYFTPKFAGFKAGISYARDGGEGSGPVDNNAVATGPTDFVDIGASYDHSFGGLDLGLSARYGIASGTAGTPNDPEIWGGGINLGWNGFTIGGSYAEQDGTPTDDGRSYDVGIGYSNGPWGYSLTYFNGENIDDENAITNSREELDILIAAATYTVNKNFKVSAFLADVDFTEQLNDAGVANGSDDVSGTVLGLGAKFSF